MRISKLFLLQLVFFLALESSHAQQLFFDFENHTSSIEKNRWFLGGHGFYRESEFNFSALFRPELGYFFLDNVGIVARGGAELTNAGDSRNYDALGMFMYNLPVINRFSIYAAGGGGYVMRRVRMLTDKAKFIVRTGHSWQAEVGINYFLNDYIIFRTAGVYSRVSLNPASTDNAGSEPLVSTTNSLVFGFQIIF